MTDTRYCFVRDDECGNYLIPVELKGDFKRMLLEGEADYWAEFNELFDLYRIDSMCNWTFTDPKENA